MRIKIDSYYNFNDCDDEYTVINYTVKRLSKCPFQSHVLVNKKIVENNKKLVECVREHIRECGGLNQFPKWHELDHTTLHHILSNPYEMHFVDCEDEEKSEIVSIVENIAVDIYKFPILKSSVIIGEEEDLVLTVYMAAVCCVDWYGWGAWLTSQH